MIFRCPFCKTPVEPTQRTCPACSQPMLKNCATCGEEISVRAAICKYCGDEREAAPAPQPEIEFIEERAATIPWESRGGVISRWWRTMWESSFHPARFMKNLPREGGCAKPIAYVYGFFVQALLVGVIVASFVGLGAVLGGHRLRPDDTAKALALVLVLIPVGYVLSAAGTFVASLFWHVMGRLAGGKAKFRETFRMVAYSSGVCAWGLVPGIGRLLELIFGTLLLYHGFREVHGLSGRRAILAIAMPAIVLLTAVGVIALVAIGAGAGR
ncbi:MAG: YIP1 family protein [Planctomycetes bacterium]|nr:YIP1 family protein [Planctomycetota bacterium]